MSSRSQFGNRGEARRHVRQIPRTEASAPKANLGAMSFVLFLLAAFVVGFTINKPGQAAHACNIKGNISQTTGARIYHVPGQKYYDATVINPRAGERWFCSEAEARAAGWRQSRI